MAKAKKTTKATKPKTKLKTVSDADLLFHAMYLTSVIDGTALNVELQVIEGLLTSLPEFGDTSIDKLVATSKAIALQYGGTIDSLIALTAIKSKSQRIKCFLLAAEVAYASGGIGKAEAALLRTMATVLGLDPTTTKPIIKVLGLKYAQ